MTVFLLFVALMHPEISRAAEPLEYNRDIRPILADHCFACHGADSAARKADLRLDQREAAIEFGAIIEGKPDESELIARILSDDPDLVMPPHASKNPLTEAQKEALKQWVAAGANYQPHWSFIAPQRPSQPAVKNTAWSKNAIDRFVLARLEANGLSPAPEANASTLFRRLYLDITGLPPVPNEVIQFVADYRQRKDAALSEWIDRLMSTTAWGEHRARYWLDAARYGDTHGLHFDNYREMWIYRDWVIRAFNRNLPFDQFTVEQLAGDLLPDPTTDQLIATGFQRCNITTNEGGTIDEENLANYASDRVQTFGWVYLGLTTNCAQCHDHKFDPLTMKDYYSLAAFFRNTTQGPKDGNVADGRGPSIMVPSAEDQPRWNALPDEIASAKQKRDARKKDARSDFKKWLDSVTPDSIGQDIPNDKLVLHLPLNEGQGKELQAIGLKESLIQVGKLNWDQNGQSGPTPVIKSGATLEVGNVGDFERNHAFSYGAWVKTARKDAQAGILAKMDVKSSYRGWDLWQNGQSFGTHIIDAWPGNALKVVTRNRVVKPGKWQHVFVTYNGSGKPAGVKIFVDGREEPIRVEQQSLKADASIRTPTPLRVGQRSEGAIFEGGAVQDVRLYDRQLSGNEVSAIAENSSMQKLLSIAAEKRTPQQAAKLYQYYLANHDAAYPELAASVERLEAEQAAIRSRSPVTHIQKGKPNSPAMAHILMRGAYDKPGDQVSAAPPASLHAMPAGAAPNRLGLAQWVVDSQNPLTARVTVNRFWQEVFGQGIVLTAEDFGIMGAPPSHPELLDWLAVEFQENGWDVKRLFKLMLMSATYRQAAITTPEKLEKDRDNILLSRGPRFRMDAEMIRDCSLAASELLSKKMYGPGTKPYQPQGIWDIVGLPEGNTRIYVQDKGENLYRRSIYNFWKRMAPPPNLETFNAPSREVCTVRRERTNTPLQALVTLNDPQFVEAARNLAQKAILNGGDQFEDRLQFVAQRLLARKLRTEEQAIARSSFDDLAAYYTSHIEDGKKLIAVGDSKPAEQVDVATLAAWTMLVNELMNLDETLNK
ncbi:Planctomycete cytochrome C [Gimesia fumaroli]|uniref:Planctomycete cytochrome C n=2 Tax=Gimesia fumaroli TaxID=2527976 RepID=A0A518I9Z1_9PLAN|nr:Planctomycete cytochrome C [Gimesia fumaroli]